MIAAELFRPLSDRLLVKRLPAPTGTIVTPETVEMPLSKGLVLAVGPGAKNRQGKTIPVAVKKGDIVFFAVRSADYQEGDLALIREGDVLVAEFRPLDQDLM